MAIMCVFSLFFKVFIKFNFFFKFNVDVLVAR